MALDAAELARGIAGPQMAAEREREQEVSQRQLGAAFMRALESKDAVAMMNALREIIRSVNTMV
ncbi:MAG: hypothetical protein KC492_36910 [Myxococcales bacterium]|nr:hypothetical protein [Myxococcales bacterium]